MKNIQIIDGARNAAYAIFSVTDSEFATIFPGAGQDIEFIEDVISRCGAVETAELMKPVWTRPVAKPQVIGIHGTLFYELAYKKVYYEDKREPVIDWRVVD